MRTIPEEPEEGCEEGGGGGDEAPRRAQGDCVVCLAATAEPVPLPCSCSAAYCAPCWTEWISRQVAHSSVGRCPTCRAAVRLIFNNATQEYSFSLALEDPARSGDRQAAPGAPRDGPERGQARQLQGDLLERLRQAGRAVPVLGYSARPFGQELAAGWARGLLAGRPCSGTLTIIQRLKLRVKSLQVNWSLKFDLFSRHFALQVGYAAERWPEGAGGQGPFVDFWAQASEAGVAAFILELQGVRVARGEHVQVRGAPTSKALQAALAA